MCAPRKESETVCVGEEDDPLSPQWRGWKIRQVGEKWHNGERESVWGNVDGRDSTRRHDSMSWEEYERDAMIVRVGWRWGGSVGKLTLEEDGAKSAGFRSRRRQLGESMLTMWLAWEGWILWIGEGENRVEGWGKGSVGHISCLWDFFRGFSCV